MQIKRLLLVGVLCVVSHAAAQIPAGCLPAPHELPDDLRSLSTNGSRNSSRHRLKDNGQRRRIVGPMPLRVVQRRELLQQLL